MNLPSKSLGLTTLKERNYEKIFYTVNYILREYSDLVFKEKTISSNSIAFLSLIFYETVIGNYICSNSSHTKKSILN